MIPYEEYVAHRTAEKKTFTATKLTSQNGLEEDWDDEPSCPPRGTLPGVRSTLPSLENEWRLMADQDPHPKSVAGDSGHDTMTTTTETEPVMDNEELSGAVGGTDGNTSTGYCFDVKWKEENLLIEINDENVAVHRTPAASLTPVPVSMECEMFSPQESPWGKKPCNRDLTAAQLSKSAPPLCLKPDSELVWYGTLGLL